MSKAKRILCALTAAVLLLSVCLSGCSAPKLTIGGTAKKAATIGDTTISTGEYMSYLYNEFYNFYYSQGLYQYAQYGYDVWTQEYTYGEGDDAQKVDLNEYLKLLTKDAIIRQVALTKMLKEHNISWIAEDETKIDEDLKTLKKDAYLSYGFSNENFITAYKALNLNESSLFYTMYGKDGERAVPESDRKTYFDENYVSYKMLSMPMTDSQGADLDAAGQKEITDKLDTYLAQYNKDKNFEAVMDAYNAANASEGAETQKSTDADNRKNADTANMSDAKLAEAIRNVPVGTAKVVTYKANDTTLTAALIVRLDPQNPTSVFTDETENILYGMKFKEFDTEVQKVVDSLTVKFNNSIVKKCNPKDFVPEQK